MPGVSKRRVWGHDARFRGWRRHLENLGVTVLGESESESIDGWVQLVLCSLDDAEFDKPRKIIVTLESERLLDLAHFLVVLLFHRSVIDPTVINFPLFEAFNEIVEFFQRLLGLGSELQVLLTTLLVLDTLLFERGSTQL